MQIHPQLKALQGGIVVSVQAERHEPLGQLSHLTALAQSALNGGAVGLRLAQPDFIAGIIAACPGVPVIGIIKPETPLPDAARHVYITPTLADCEAVIAAGAPIVAMDATLRPRPDGSQLANIVAQVCAKYPGIALIADCDTLESALAAAELGFDCVSTTLSGYTVETQAQAQPDAPDFELLAAFIAQSAVPIILEGRIWEPAQVKKAFELGAFSVVVGSAITRPQLITQRFVAASQCSK